MEEQFQTTKVKLTINHSELTQTATNIKPYLLRLIAYTSDSVLLEIWLSEDLKQQLGLDLKNASKILAVFYNIVIYLQVNLLDRA